MKANLVGAMPPNYPTEVPLLVDIQPLKGLGADQVEELLALSERTAAENLGMPSAYTVAMAVQEWLTENNLPGNDGSMYSGMHLSFGLFRLLTSRSFVTNFRNASTRTKEGGGGEPCPSQGSY